MIANENMKNNLEKVKNAMLAVQRHPWEQGVCMQALYELGDITTAVAMAHDAVLRAGSDGRLALIGGSAAVTDPASCGEVVFRAYELTKDRFYLDAAKKQLDFLLKLAPRTANGTICHNMRSFHEGFSPVQIWADSIYMAPPFIAVMGYHDEAVAQINGMWNYLADSETGLLRHIYDAGRGCFVRDKLWATGNSWALLGMARVYEAISEDLLKDGTSPSQTDKKEKAEKLLLRALGLLDAMLAYALPDGRFHDILDDPTSFSDGTSAMMTAAFIYRGVKKGYVSDKYLSYADKVFSTMEQYVDEYGIIRGVCGCPDFVAEGTSAESMAAYIMMHAYK